MTVDLVYVTDREPGISRRRRGRGFSYTAPDGTVIARGLERERIDRLAVPLAYEDVWICAHANGHLQATGRNARSRKQYRYHPDWSTARSHTKFDHLVTFAEHLPAIRRRVDRDLKSDPGDLEFALAAAVSIIDRAAFRVEHPEYALQNGSYGVLTLRRRHLSMAGEDICLRFTGKGGHKAKKRITDRKLQKLLQAVSDSPGATLLTWVDEVGDTHVSSSEQLNAYLSRSSGDDTVTAKTFRTSAGTLAAFKCAEAGGATIKDMAEAASQRLHNTPTVTRDSYIHPAAIDLAGTEKLKAEAVSRSGLFAVEQRLLGYLNGV